jgi:predicted phage terminase large subunit-like protein
MKTRREARHSLLHFTRYTFPQYKADPVHALICATLDRVVAGEIRRLMIFAPPQHGKSQLVSVHLPAYWLGRRPDDPVILTSYGATLAERFSREARGIVESADYGWNLFEGVTTRRDSRSVQQWFLASPHRGNLRAAGVGGPITGHGALLGIIDDPFENWKQAQSQTQRDLVWDWYRGTFRTRIWEGGVIILVMTRWHEDDLAGRLLQTQPDDWVVLRLPALAETQGDRDAAARRMNLSLGDPDPLGRVPGEPLSPGRYSQAELAAIKTDVGPIVWAAEYQGDPRAPEGNWFQRWMFPIVEAVPAQVRRVRYWDKAATPGSGKYSAGVLIAVAGGMVFVEDVVRGRWSSVEREKVVRQTADLDRRRGMVKVWVEQEPGSGGKESAEATIRNLGGFDVEADKVTGDKDSRLLPFHAQAQAGNVKLVRGNWNGAYIEEMCAVPTGSFRDQADATAGAYNKLMGAEPGYPLPRTAIVGVKDSAWG